MKIPIRQAMVDIDTAKQGSIRSVICQMKKKIKRLNCALRLNIREIEIRKTYHGYHIYIAFKKNITDIELCLMQSILGDDWERAIQNWNKIKIGAPVWNVLFSRKSTFDGKLLSLESKYKVVRI